VALGVYGTTLNDELNRLANGGTYRLMSAMVDQALAAKQWATQRSVTPTTTDPFVGASTTTVVASTANGRMVFDAINGRVTVTLSSTITGDIDAGRYAYDLVLDSGTTVTRILEGKFIVTGAVTT